MTARDSLTFLTPSDGFEPFSSTETEQVSQLNRALAAAFLTVNPERIKQALRIYLQTMAIMSRHYRMFEIANHRIFRAKDSLFIPYDAHGQLSIYQLGDNTEQLIHELRLPHGTLITDHLIFQLCGIQGDVIDLEREIYHLDIDDVPAIQVARLRDLADLLRRLNDSGSRHEAVYLLRFLVARLCSNSYRGLPGAKNLQPEITRVRQELSAFMNGPFATRLRLPTRILVRNISGLVSQPKVIDEVWQDTIDLSEVHVRGSVISNEIRRSTHHAMGKHTLQLAKAYHQWLCTGEADFPDPEREIPTAQDEAARSRSEVRDLVGRIVDNLEQLLGSAQIATRLTEWRSAYADELLGCDSSRSLEEELESLVVKGIHECNRWTYLHRLRIIARKAGEDGWDQSFREPFENSLATLQQIMPDSDEANTEQLEAMAREAVDVFCRAVRKKHQDNLFSALDDLLAGYEEGAFPETFERCCSLRRELESLVGTGIFTSQRYLLHQLDCILEEMGFFSLRHVASAYSDQGIDLPQCLHFVYLCAGNLDLDGLFSRELWDLSSMLINPTRSDSELLDVLEQIQRNYHRLVRRVSEAYEVMARHLGYGENEMRAVLANFQRTMHDLNSLVHFSDLARSHIAEQQAEATPVDCRQAGEGPWDFVHLSHREDIVRRVEKRNSVSLQARFGGKGSGLIYIAYLGIPTRDAFVIPTVLPRMGLQNLEPERLEHEVKTHLDVLQNDIARNEGVELRLGDRNAPLLLAIRGGSVFSMPGMLATVVFVGMTDEVAEALAKDDEWYAWDAFRRFLASYAAAVWNLDLEELGLVEKIKRRHGVSLKTDLPGAAMKEVVESSKDAIREAGYGEQLDAILADAELQVLTAIAAVHGSWKSERARRYRAIKHLSEGWHTAVIVQHMASGNRTNTEDLKPGLNEMNISLTGVIPHTRMKSSGFRAFTGEIKFSACGDDLVGGLTGAKSFEPVQRLHELAPMLERKLNHFSARLRRFLGSDAEIEFTVDRGVVSVLQARSAQMELKFNPRTFLDPGEPAGRGIGISGAAFCGLVAFDEEDALSMADKLHENPELADGVLLVLENPTPDEIPLILSVDGLLAARGGSTSHAAVAIHGIEDQPYAAVLGVAGLRVGRNEAVITRDDDTVVAAIGPGEVLSIHGQTGEIFIGSRVIVDDERWGQALLPPSTTSG